MPKYREASVEEFLDKRQMSTRNGVVYRAARSPKSFNPEERSQTFVMTDESVDSYGDIVKANGADLMRFEANPIALLNHQSSLILGSWSEVAKKPQRIEGKVTLATEGTAPHIDMAFNLMSQGILRGASIGFMPTKLEMRLDDDGDPMWCYIINEWEMYECSVVSVPANPGALARSAINGDDIVIVREYLEQVLDEWARTPEGLLIPRAEFEKAYTVVVEKVAADAVRAAAPVVEPVVEAAAPDEATKAAAAEAEEFPKFLARATKGDTFRVYSQMVRNAADPILVTFVEKGVSLHHKVSGDIDMFEFHDGVSAEHKAAIAARLLELEASEAPPATDENKTGTASPIVVTLSADTTEVEAAIEKADGLLTRLAKKFPLFFSKAAAEQDERIEPNIVPETPATPPTDEEIAAARAKAAAVRARLVSKDLIAA